jgi:hypothetical protein
MSADLHRVREQCLDKDGPCVECVERVVREAVREALERAAKIAAEFKPIGAGELKLRARIAEKIRSL